MGMCCQQCVLENGVRDTHSDAHMYQSAKPSTISERVEPVELSEARASIADS